MTSASVIIPAHNEAAIIGSTLDSVLASTNIDALDVVVVCNGCTDDTAQIAASHGPKVRVIETPVGSKAKALELGRQATPDQIRIYLDADITITPDVCESVIATLSQPGIHGSAPAIELAEPAVASRFLRWYAAIWRQAPYFHRELIGSGFYALSAEAQDRIGEWPTIIADDLVALCHLGVDERRTAPRGSFTHTLPSSLREVLGAEVRREAGRIEFEQWAAEAGRSVAEEDPGGRWLTQFLTKPKHWLGLGLYVGVKVLAKQRAKRQLAAGPVAWSSPERAT